MVEKVRIYSPDFRSQHPKVFVDDSIIQDPEPKVKTTGLMIEPCENKLKKTATIKIDYGKVQLNVVKDQKVDKNRWLVTSATVNLARCRYGRNSRIFTTDREIIEAISIANQMINQLVTRFMT